MGNPWKSPKTIPSMCRILLRPTWDRDDPSPYWCVETLTLGQGLHWDYLRGPSPASLHADYPMNYDHSEISDKRYFIVAASQQLVKKNNGVKQSIKLNSMCTREKCQAGRGKYCSKNCSNLHLNQSAVEIMQGNNNRMGPRITMIGTHYC